MAARRPPGLQASAANVRSHFMAEGRTISRRKSPPSMREAKWFSPHLADDLLVLLPADLPEAQGQTAARGCDQLARRANQQKAVQPRAQKYSASRATQISPITPRISSTKGALATSRTRGEMRWTRRAQLTLAPDADGEVVWFGRRGAGAKFHGLSRGATEAKEPFSGKSTK
jgi:hypothetical protein